jgi:glycerol kinase
MAHIARASLESIALQSTVLLNAMQRDACTTPEMRIDSLRVDGGACANNLLMQMQADLMGIPVVRPQTIETTALGAAMLAAMQSGMWSRPEDLKAQLAIERVFEPKCSRDQAQSKLAAWETAVRSTQSGLVESAADH